MLSMPFMGTIARLVLLLCLCLNAAAQESHKRLLIAPSPSTPLWANLFVQKPMLWLDAWESVSNSIADGATVTNYTDLSGNGNRCYSARFIDNVGNTNFVFSTTDSGCIDFKPNATDSYIQRQFDPVLSGVLSSNQFTIAIRIYWVGPYGCFIISDGVSPQINCQLLGGDLYFDIGTSGNYRVHAAQPGDMANNWRNLIYVHNPTTSIIYYEGSSLVSGTVDKVLGTNSIPANSKLSFLGGQTGATFAYKTKKILAWPLAFGVSDIILLNNWMTTNAP
jgi:hypothetical protein